jgi:mono/diheme cytochrome c family protein
MEDTTSCGVIERPWCSVGCEPDVIGMAMWRKAALICAFACLGAAGCRKSTASYMIPTEEASRPNPFPATPDVIATGKKLYDGTDCALCHGAAGDGKGPLSRDLKYNTRDWRDPAALSNLSDGELFYIISKGKGAMPGYADRESPEHLWQMVDYVRSFKRQ